MMSFKYKLKTYYLKKIKKMSDSDILIEHLRKIGTKVVTQLNFKKTSNLI